LRFQLFPSTTCLLPVEALTEILNVPVAAVVPIPDMPAWVMGVYNWRGDILWVVDLGHLVGMPPWYQHSRAVDTHAVVVLRDRASDMAATTRSSGTLGLVVQQVEDIESYLTDSIQLPSPAHPDIQLTPFLQGYWLGSETVLPVFKSSAIFAAMPRQSPTS
jgi:positive phototaxis protein PixI